MRRQPERFLRAWACILLGTVWAGCGPRANPPTVQTNLPQTTPDQPWVVGLPATTLLKLETIRKKGLVFG